MFRIWCLAPSSFTFLMALPSCLLHRVNYRGGADTHRCHACKQIDDLLLIVREAVSIELLSDRRVLGFLLFVLVENPFKSRAVA
jgi:hypothetical protein